MHFLFTEAVAGGGDRVADAFRADRHGVTTCHVPTGFCRALAPGRNRCPLDDRTDPVDGVVDVRGSDDVLTTRELGVVCGIRAGLPVYLVEAVPGHPAGVPADLVNRVVVASVEELRAALRRSATRITAEPSDV